MSWQNAISGSNTVVTGRVFEWTAGGMRITPEERKMLPAKALVIGTCSKCSKLWIDLPLDRHGHLNNDSVLFQDLEFALDGSAQARVWHKNLPWQNERGVEECGGELVLVKYDPHAYFFEPFLDWNCGWREEREAEERYREQYGLFETEAA